MLDSFEPRSDLAIYSTDLEKIESNVKEAYSQISLAIDEAGNIAMSRLNG